MVWEYEYDEESQKMRISTVGAIFDSSLEDYDVAMAATIDKLLELKRVARIVLAGTREYEYDFSESKMLLEIALALEKIVNTRIVTLRNIVIAGCENEAPQRFAFLRNATNDLRYDPIEAYKNLLREIRRVNVRRERTLGAEKNCNAHYLQHALLPIQQILEGTKLIQAARPVLAEHKNRSLYRKIFHPTIRPNFIYTRYISLPPANAELVERYAIDDTDIEIYKIPGKIRMLYHIIPQEFKLNEVQYTLLDTARRYLGRHEPRDIELSEPEQIRENLYRIGIDMLRDLSIENEYNIGEEEISKLASILSRYTAGLGILDLVLKDENVQDIAINSPVGQQPMYIYHGNYQECETNVVPSREDAESWATRFRLLSGRPLDEANPVLDTELYVPGGRARVAAITRTLSPEGLGFAFRRHRDKPWTFPLFIKNRMIDSFSAGLMWFLIDGARTLLIAGTRSSGKCLSGDTLIRLEDNSLVAIKDIENVEKRILALNEKGRLVPAEKTNFYKRTANKLLYIKLRNGREIKVTPEHPLLTPEGWKPANELSIGRKLTFIDLNTNSNSETILLQQKVCFNEVISIEVLEGIFDVYDISVPDYHNFVANDIIVHNSSFLGACMVQIMPKIRIVSVEDTLEIPVPQLRDLGYNIERLKSRSVITNVETELPAEEALRAALRLGDSALIIGEVRSKEALALYEAMRIGALANVVAGTIHGDSAYGVFDRVVNDLGVPPTSFKATDIVLIANMLKSADGLRSFRRVVEITEVRKHWKSDPAAEGGFENLMEYSAKDDILKPTKTLLTGESVILNDIAERVREWRGNWDAIWGNIKLRGKIMQALIDLAEKKNNPDILEAQSVVESNSMFHLIGSDVKEEVGALDNDLIYERWQQWMKRRWE